MILFIYNINHIVNIEVIDNLKNPFKDLKSLFQIYIIMRFNMDSYSYKEIRYVNGRNNIKILLDDNKDPH